MRVVYATEIRYIRCVICYASVEQDYRRSGGLFSLRGRIFYSTRVLRPLGLARAVISFNPQGRAAQDLRDMLGRKVRKLFHAGWFEGVIDGCSTKDRWLHITYEVEAKQSPALHLG